MKKQSVCVYEQSTACVLLHKCMHAVYGHLLYTFAVNVGNNTQVTGQSIVGVLLFAFK